jgi:hypothetical protein
MKKNKQIMITAFCMLFTIFSYGQPPVKSFKTSFGVKCGVNLSTIKNGQEGIDFSPDQIAGFNGGVFMNIHFGFRNQGSASGTGLLGIQPELLFSQQGFSFGGESVTFNYLSLPILAKFYVTNGINLEVGPSFNYMLSASPSTATIGGSEIDNANLKGSKDIGLVFGAGYEMKTGLIFDLRYNYGLSAVASNLAWKNQVIAASIGWKF